MAVDSLRAISTLYPKCAVVAPEIASAKLETGGCYKRRMRGNVSSLRRRRSTLSLMNPEVEEGEEEMMVSGWGEAEDMKEDLLKDWGEVLEKWDGKQREKTRPKQLSKLCRKVSQYLDFLVCMCIYNLHLNVHAHACVYLNVCESAYYNSGENSLVCVQILCVGYCSSLCIYTQCMCTNTYSIM